MKSIFSISFLITLSALLAYGKQSDEKSVEKSGKKSRDNLSVEVSRAKEIFTQENRKEALAEIDKLLIKSNTKKEKERLLAKRKLFLNQFFTSTGFQKYQEAKMIYQAGHPTECLKVIQMIAKQDQDNAHVLGLKFGCVLRAQSWNLADETYQQLLPYGLANNEQLIEYANAMTAQKKIESAKHILDAIKTNDIETIEKIILAKAQLLVVAGKTSEAIELLKQDQETYMDHYEVAHALADIFISQTQNEWMARKYFGLFLSGCRRKDRRKDKSEPVKDVKFEEKCKKANDSIQEIDRRLGV